MSSEFPNHYQTPTNKNTLNCPIDPEIVKRNEEILARTSPLETDVNKERAAKVIKAILERAV